MVGLIQPTKAWLKNVSVGGRSWIESDATIQFNVREFRIFEDVCKSYFTAQLVIETYLNNYENFLFPSAETIISFECPRSDGVTTKTYTEKFRVYSYESKAMSGGADVRLEHTISLIGQEYYNDRHNVVTENHKLTTGTAVAKQIHDRYIGANGNLDVKVPSTGHIANETSAHQIINKKPIKAIHDVLDRCVFGSYKSCAPTYFRNKPGYVIAPLQMLLESAPVTGNFIHVPAQGSSIADIMLGYHSVIHLRPMSPAGEASAGARTSDISGLLKSATFLDLETGSTIDRAGKIAQAAAGATGSTKEVLQGATKGIRGGSDILNVINNLHQFKQIDKNGPGRYNVSQEALITAITYSQKYWVSVPSQSGLQVTCGDRIRVVFPINDRLTVKTLFVPRLIHECRLTETVGPDNKRKGVSVNAKTELYGVQWA